MNCRASPVIGNPVTWGAWLESEHESESHSLLVSSGQIGVCESAHILHAENLEYVGHSDYSFHIRLVVVHHVGPFREVHQDVVSLVLFLIGVVLAREVAP